MMDRILCCIIFLCVCSQSEAVGSSCQWKQFDFQPLDNVM